MDDNPAYAHPSFNDSIATIDPTKDIHQFSTKWVVWFRLRLWIAARFCANH